MALHYRNGSVVLKVGSNWYPVSISLLDSVPYLAPGQVGSEITVGGSPSEYAVLRASDGSYFKIYLSLLAGQVYTSNQLLETPEPSQRVFLKGADNIRYELVVQENESDGEFYLGLVTLTPSASLSDRCSPWRLLGTAGVDTPRTIGPASVDTPRTIGPAGAVCEAEIKVP